LKNAPTSRDDDRVKTSATESRDYNGTKTLVLVGSAGILGYGLLAYVLSFAVRYISWVGNLESIATWSPIILIFWLLSAGAMVAIGRGAPLSEKFAGV
jgi:hypothetical protein